MGLLTGNGGFGSAPKQPTVKKTAPTGGARPINMMSAPLDNGGYGGNQPVSIPPPPVGGDLWNVAQGWNEQSQAAGQAAGAYAGDVASNAAERAYIDRMMGLSGSQYGLDQQALGIGHNQQNASMGVDNAYARAQMGYANQGADLARQLLGLDRSNLGVNRSDYKRQWDADKWGLNNQQAAAGSSVSAGARTQDADMAKKLWFANMGFDIEGKRINTREDQVGLNLAEQLAGYQNRLNQNGVSGQYGNQQYANQMAQAALGNAGDVAGFDQAYAQNLIGAGGISAAQAALQAQLQAQYAANRVQPQGPVQDQQGWFGW